MHAVLVQGVSLPAISTMYASTCSGVASADARQLALYTLISPLPAIPRKRVASEQESAGGPPGKHQAG